ncbi:hypothetical protein [Brevundimonas sp. R86498]|uniref:hypothetical protein n=1 Tax=Brevundimonas sp. R86498 TaxID=3093845 RepID=UPI0037CADA61
MRKAISPRPSTQLSYVRSTAHRLGFRFRLGGAGLPGKPHLVFPVYRLAVFTVDCAAYEHECQPHGPFRPTDYFAIQRRLVRSDLAIFQHVLGHRGWRSHVIFGCDTLDRSKFEQTFADVVTGSSQMDPATGKDSGKLSACLPPPSDQQP